MRNKGILSGILCFLLILTVSIVPMVAFAADGNSQDTDYSKEGSYFNTVYSAGDVLRSLGYEVSDAEYDYLKEYGGLNIKYEEVTTQHVRVETYEGNIKADVSVRKAMQLVKDNVKKKAAKPRAKKAAADKEEAPAEEAQSEE